MVHVRGFTQIGGLRRVADRVSPHHEDPQLASLLYNPGTGEDLLNRDSRG